MSIKDKLQAPFHEDEYEWRVQHESGKGTMVLVLCYVQARAIQNRLDDTVGPFGWSTSYAAGPDGGVICRLSIKDPETGEWVTKEDGAENTDIEAVKGGISSALKRAGSVWGIGRLLYKLPTHWLTLTDDRSGHYHKTKSGDVKYWVAPRLPDWAVSGRTDPPKPPDDPKTNPNKKPLDMKKLRSDKAVEFLKEFQTTSAALEFVKNNIEMTDEQYLEIEAFINELFEEKGLPI